jgi:hypothetical protein
MANAVLAELALRGIEPPERILSGQLIRLGEQSSGLQLLGSILSCAEGPRTLRIISCPKVGDPKWPKIADLIATEALFSLGLPAHNLVCIYDERNAPASIVHSHKEVMTENGAQSNPHHVEPLVFLRKLRDDAEQEDFAASSWVPI